MKFIKFKLHNCGKDRDANDRSAQLDMSLTMMMMMMMMMMMIV